LSSLGRETNDIGEVSAPGCRLYVSLHVVLEFSAAPGLEPDKFGGANEAESGVLADFTGRPLRTKRTLPFWVSRAAMILKHSDATLPADVPRQRKQRSARPLRDGNGRGEVDRWREFNAANMKTIRRSCDF